MKNPSGIEALAVPGERKMDGTLGSTSRLGWRISTTLSWDGGREFGGSWLRRDVSD